MERIPENPVLKFHPGTLENVRKMNNFENAKKLDEAIDILQEWARKQPHFIVKEFDREFLEKIIINNKGLLERSKTRLDKLCTLKTLLPHYFKPVNVVKDLCNLEFMTDTILPQMTPDYYRVYFLKNSGKHFTVKTFTDFYIRLVAYCQYLLRNDYSAGIICIFDLLEASVMEIITNTDMTALRQTITVLMDGFGTRVKGMYTISDSKFISASNEILKQVLSKKVGERLHVLKSIDALKDIVPVDILPEEYGGKEKTLPVLHETWMKEITSDAFLEYLQKMNDMKTDESLRQADKFNEDYSGMAGTFRALNVD